MIKQSFRKLTKAARLSVVSLYRWGLLNGVGAAIEHEAILTFLSKHGVVDVVDVGANCGQFTLLCRHWLPQATISAFEPVQKSADKFRKIFAKDQNTRLIQAAIGATSSELDMHISKALDSSSLLPIGHAQSKAFPGTEESHLERVQVAPLDAFVNRGKLASKSLLKIDVQGYELEVLRGCESMLDCFCAVYVECSFDELYDEQALAHEVIDWIHAHGFYFARVGTLTFGKNGVAVQGDFLFLRSV